MTRQRVIAAVAAVLIASCGNESPPHDAAAGKSAQEPVVVYASTTDGARLEKVIAEFTQETGRRVTLRQRGAATIVDEVIANHGSPPADVLVTPSVYGVWKAADEGGLRPLQSERVMASVSEKLRDPDGAWTAIDVTAATIVFDVEKFDAGAIASYTELGNDYFRGHLCLSSSALPVNHTLIAALISGMGARPAERIVRQWMANLAAPAFATESELVAALQDGRCGIAIVSSDAQINSPRLRQLRPSVAHIDIMGAGIARHARQPAAALQLIEWLVEKRAATLNEAELQQNVSAVAWRAEDATKLAERARYP